LAKQKFEAQEARVLAKMDSGIEQALYLFDRLKDPMGELGVPYSYRRVLEKIFFASRNIIRAQSETESNDLWILGTEYVTKIYAGKVLKSDLVYVYGNCVRTLHTTKDLKELRDSDQRPLRVPF